MVRALLQFIQIRWHGLEPFKSTRSTHVACNQAPSNRKVDDGATPLLHLGENLLAPAAIYEVIGKHAGKTRVSHINIMGYTGWAMGAFIDTSSCFSVWQTMIHILGTSWNSNPPALMENSTVWFFKPQSTCGCPPVVIRTLKNSSINAYQLEICTWPSQS